MKKLTALFLMACMCVLVFTACGHTHTLTKVDAVAATCDTAGNSEYYTCECGLYFSDAAGTAEIAKDSWVIPATGHSYASTWTFNETHHWKAATCTHSTEKGEYAEHTLIDNVCACGYVAVTYTVADGAAWNQVFTGEYLKNGTVTIENNSYQNGVIMAGEENSVIMKSNDTAMVMIISAGTNTIPIPGQAGRCLVWLV